MHENSGRSTMGRSPAKKGKEPKKVSDHLQQVREKNHHHIHDFRKFFSQNLLLCPSLMKISYFYMCNIHILVYPHYQENSLFNLVPEPKMREARELTSTINNFFPIPLEFLISY